MKKILGLIVFLLLVQQLPAPINSISGATVSTGGSSSNAPPISKLIAWWDLDESSGTRADALGNVDLTDINTVLSATGKVGNAALFDKANQESLEATDPSLMEMAGSFTVVCWVYFDSTTGVQNMVSKYSVDSNEREWMLRYDSSAPATLEMWGSVDGTVANAANSDFGFSPSTGVWYFCVGYWDDENNQLGSWARLDTSGWTTPSFDVDSGLSSLRSNGVADFTLGVRPDITTPQDWFDGRLDEVSIWAGVLTNAQLEWLFNEVGGTGAGRAFSDLDN